MFAHFQKIRDYLAGREACDCLLAHTLEIIRRDPYSISNQTICDDEEAREGMVDWIVRCCSVNTHWFGDMTDDVDDLIRVPQGVPKIMHWFTYSFLCSLGFPTELAQHWWTQLINYPWVWKVILIWSYRPKLYYKKLKLQGSASALTIWLIAASRSDQKTNKNRKKAVTVILITLLKYLAN